MHSLATRELRGVRVSQLHPTLWLHAAAAAAVVVMSAGHGRWRD